jgi:hypothetical protein
LVDIPNEQVSLRRIGDHDGKVIERSSFVHHTTVVPTSNQTEEIVGKFQSEEQVRLVHSPHNRSFNLSENPIDRGIQVRIGADPLVPELLEIELNP